MNHHRSSHEIEREIERERSELSDTVNEIQRRFTPEAVVQQVGRSFREHGGEFGNSVQQSVKQNPVALALTGVGLAWLMFGRSFSERGETASREPGRPLHDRSDFDETDSREVFDENRDRLGRIGGEGRGGSYSPDSRPMPAGTNTRSGNGIRNYPDWYDDSDDQTAYDPALGKIKKGVDAARDAASSAADSVSDNAKSIASSAKSASDTASETAGAAGDKISSAASSAADSVSGAAYSAAQTASDAAGSAAARAAALRERLARGTEDLSEAARERVIAAREKAILVRDRMQAKASRGWEKGRDGAVDFFDQQPLVVGALAIAVGAALGGALPRTKREDDMFGGMSDDLVEEAERVYRVEREKAEKVASAAVKEAKRAGKEAVKSTGKATKTVTKRAKTAGSRVKKAATREAKKQDLGKPKA